MVLLRTQKWPVRLSVRTNGFHPLKRGSTPLRATNEGKKPSIFLNARLFCFRLKNKQFSVLNNLIYLKTKLLQYTFFQLQPN